MTTRVTIKNEGPECITVRDMAGVPETLLRPGAEMTVSLYGNKDVMLAELVVKT
jgi:hypothetical protein